MKHSNHYDQTSLKGQKQAWKFLLIYKLVYSPYYSVSVLVITRLTTVYSSSAVVIVSVYMHILHLQMIIA